MPLHRPRVRSCPRREHEVEPIDALFEPGLVDAREAEPRVAMTRITKCAARCEQHAVLRDFFEHRHAVVAGPPRKIYPQVCTAGWTRRGCLQASERAIT